VALEEGGDLFDDVGQSPPRQSTRPDRDPDSPIHSGELVVLGRKVGGHYGKQMGQDLLFWSRDILWDEFLEPAVRASRPHAQRIIVEPVAAQLTMSRVFWAGPLLPFFLFGGVLIQAVENVLAQPEPEFDAV